MPCLQESSDVKKNNNMKKTCQLQVLRPEQRKQVHTVYTGTVLLPLKAMAVHTCEVPHYCFLIKVDAQIFIHFRGMLKYV